jgi:NAD(P)-dependent dehydrogenase (short-subunit alcohol dehydrogenase family)
MSSVDLSGRIVLLTGAARGLGYSMAVAFANAGAEVVCVDLAGEIHLLSEGAGADTHPVRLHPLAGDVSDWKSCEALVEECIAMFGRVDVLVNNASMGMQTTTPRYLSNPSKFHELPHEIWREMMATNANGPFFLAKAATQYMLQRKWGRIMNVVTSQSTMIRKGFCPYGPSKAALEAATAIWSKDLADTGITVNAILPGGPSDTRQVPVVDVPDRTKLLPTFSMNAVAIWLSTHEARGVTGRRIITSRWDSAIPPMEALKMSSEAAGWEDRLDPDQLVV